MQTWAYWSSLPYDKRFSFAPLKLIYCFIIRLRERPCDYNCKDGLFPPLPPRPHPALAPNERPQNNNIHHHSGLSYLLSRFFSEAELAAWAGDDQQDRARVTQKERPLYLLPEKKEDYAAQLGVYYRLATNRHLLLRLTWTCMGR